MALSNNSGPDLQVNLNVGRLGLSDNFLLKVSLVFFSIIILGAVGFRVAMPAQAANPISFTPQTTYHIGNGMQSIKAYDLNNDGKLDLVLVNPNGNTIDVLLGNGNGSFQSNNLYTVGNSPRGVVVGDFNSDGILDLAVVNATDNDITILFGNGDGTFTKSVTYPVGKDPRAIGIGDLNNDGKLDLVVANGQSNTISIFLGKGDGTFQTPTTINTGNFPRNVTLADFNNDGKLDLAVADFNADNIGVFLGNGDGTFNSGTYYPINGNPTVVTAGDFNNNGKLDLFTTTYQGSGLTILTGDGQGNFQVGNPINLGTNSAPIDVKIADFDGSGKQELIVTSDNQNYLDLLTNDGAGGVVQPPTEIPASMASSVIVADFNGDNSPDVAIADYSYGNVDVLLNQTNPLHVAFTIPKVTQQGVPFTFTATIENVYDSPVTTYTGTLHFTSSDNAAGLPTDYTFNASDVGTHVFTVTLPTLGTQTVTATDTTDSGIFGSRTAAVANQTVGTGTADSCNETAFKNSLSLGGYITFNCGLNPITIPFTSGTQAVVTQTNTTVDGGNLITLSGNNATRVFSVTNSVNFTLTNITLTNGTVNHSTYSSESTTRGGALYNNGVTTLLNANFISNTAIGGTGYDNGNVFGGAVYNSPSGTLNLNSTNFSDNSAQAASTGTTTYYPGDAFGGAVSSDGSITISSSNFTSNQAVGGDGNNTVAQNPTPNSYPFYGGGSGGAVYISNTINIANSNFLSNTAKTGSYYGYNATAQGGAVAGQNFTNNSITNSTFSNNNALIGLVVKDNVNSPSFASGGAIEFQFAQNNQNSGGIDNLNLADSNFSNNSVQGAESNNNVQNPSTYVVGGAVATFNSSGYETVELDNSSFTNNTAFAAANSSQFNGSGGAIFFYGGLNTINNSTFYSNTAVDGGAIDKNRTDILTVTNSIFMTNTAQGNVSYGVSGLGGGIYSDKGYISFITNTLMVNNNADSGGAIYLPNYVEVDGSQIYSNTATNSGGAIYNNDFEYGNADLVVKNSSIYNNKAHDGAAIRLQSSYQYAVANIQNSVAYSNTTTGGDGGVLEQNRGTTTVANSTLTGNSAANGGAVDFAGQIITFTNSTLANNSASAQGATVFISNTTPYTDTAIFQNTVVSNQTGNNCATANAQSLIDDGGYNLEYSGGNANSCGFSNHAQSGDPLLGPLVNNGGPTLTMALLDNSPAIGNGNNSICDSSPINGLDQRGYSRSSINCDIGAYEATKGKVGTGTPDSCTEATFKAALAKGGYITFNCGPNPITIPFTSGTQAVVTQTNTTVDGGNLVTLSGNNATRVFSVTNSVNFTLTNITIANGTVNHSANSSESTTRGGALYNNGTTTLLNANFISNTLVGGINYDYGNAYGGAVYNSPSGTLNLNNSSFSNNLAKGSDDSNYPFNPGNAFGGAVSSDGSLVVISNTFTNNEANGGNNTANNQYPNGPYYYGSGTGGAIYISGTTNIDSSKFISNSASTNYAYGYAQGGAFANQGTISDTIKNSIFNNNSAIAVSTQYSNTASVIPTAWGGAISGYKLSSSEPSNFNLVNDQFNNNTAVGINPNNYQNPSSSALGGAVFEDSYLHANIYSSSFNNNSAIAASNSTQANGSGGAIYIRSGFNTVTNSNFYSNTAIEGGAVNVYLTGILTTTNSSFISNRASDGGAIYSIAGSLGQNGLENITNTILANNTATDNGGALFFKDVSVVLGYSQVYSNSATNMGGALYNAGGYSLILTNTNLYNNTANSGGGLNSAAFTLIQSSSIFSNSATGGNGGGINEESNGAVVLANSTLTRNSAVQGGAIAFSGAELASTNTTIANNTTSAQSSNIYISGPQFNNNNSTAIFTNTILSGQMGTNCKTADAYSFVQDGGYNLEYSGGNANSCGFSNHAQNSDPVLGPLANNGGPTLTMALLDFSPAIDNGNDAVCAAFPINNVDQRGIARPIGSHCDIGAYESSAKGVPQSPASISVASGNNQTTYVNTPFASPLVASVTDTNNQPVSSVTVTFTAPNSGASGAFANNSNIFTATTDARGLVTTTIFTANNISGTYTVTASVSGVITPAVFTLTNLSQPSTTPTTTPTSTTPPTTSTPTPTTTTPTPTPPVTNNSYTYYLPFLANQANNFTTFLAFQNTTATTASINVQYYDTAGNQINSSFSCAQLAPHAECTPANPFTAGQHGAGVLVSDQPLAVIVAEATPYGGSAYAVSAGSSNSLVAPLAIRGGLGDFTTQLTIFNGGSSIATGTVKFYQQDGTYVTTADKILNIAPFTGVTFDQSTDTTLGNNFYGWAQIVGANGSTLAAQVLEQSPSSHFVAIANAQGQSQNTLYAPAIFNNAFGGFVTGANIVNPNSSPVSVTVTYYQNDGTVISTTAFTLNANAIAAIYHAATSGNGLPTSGLPNGFYGGAKVTSSGSGVVMAVNESGGLTTSGTARSGVYSAGATGGNNFGLPAVANGGVGFVTGLTIFNTSSTTVSGTIQYYNTDGSAVGSSQPFSVGAYQSAGIYQGSQAQLLGNSFYGTAIITSNQSNALIVTTNAVSPMFFYTYVEPN